MELRAARAAARRRVGAYTAIVTAVGFAWLVLAAPAATRGRPRPLHRPPAQQTQGGELLVTDATPPGPGARFELRLPLAGPSPARFLAYAASSR
jgi:hypothetical protein